FSEQDWCQDQDAQFLCSDLRMDTELVDRLVLQLNRIYPQILSDKEAHRFRNLSVPTKVRLAELLKHLHAKGEEACHEFYRGLHILAEDIYSSLPTRVIQRGKSRSQPPRCPIMVDTLLCNCPV
uniref:Uncharacterized protein n=1 Tax=Dicentrarchus labrax TaxID=13489 RepID=A0A8C4ENL5_DICLA